MRRPDWHKRGRDKPDFRDARLMTSFLAGADLIGAQMERAVLWEAQMAGTVFDFSELTGSKDAINTLSNTNLSMTTNNGGLLRFVDLTEAIFDAQTDFRNAFLQASVSMTPAFRTQMGEGDPDGPCQWVDTVIDDDTEFHGRWRGWVEAKPDEELFERWRFVGPEEYRDVTLIPSPPDCEWKTGPMSGAE